MILENNFKQTTRLFYSGQYDLGHSQISALIKDNPNQPVLYTNRALFLSQLGRQEQAVRDLQKSLQVNPINYIAYFNLFSIQTRNNEDQDAIANLCCSLSVMYLIKARITKNIQDVQRSIRYADNNVEARILCGLLYAEAKNYEKAKEEFMVAQRLIPGTIAIRKLVEFASKKIDPEYVEFGKEQEQYERQRSRKLKSSLILPADCDLVEEINIRLEQFNKLYNQINNQFGGITQKVPKQLSFSNNIQAFMLQKSQKSKVSRSNHQSAIAILQDEQFFANKSHHYETKPSFQQKNTAQNDGVESTVTAYQSSHQNGIEVIDQGEQHAEMSYQSLPGANQHDIYPLGSRQYLKIGVVNFTFFAPGEFKSLDGVYCIVTYDGGRCKLITAPAACIEGGCSWNRQFPVVGAAREAALLGVKVYNKQRDSIRDLFIGDFEVLLTSADLLRLPIFDRKGGQAGELLVHVQLCGEGVQ